MELPVKATEQFTLVVIFNEFIDGYKIINNQTLEDVICDTAAHPELEDASNLEKPTFNELMARVFHDIKEKSQA